ncbi:MAG: DUF2846 domain-containing protein [Nitrospina sp.]|jgi:hypothetical protein|nr:DUF2846 domain-containing protein [Nitrospina sp.]MBT3921798.1 DUF2846 domain-containing protein [Nitrospina sp.]MBT4557788.1 DUF2846 domain-containing protein [Nitrospina sp.]MBT5259708.1 DUF2846 domain-containing protein [Nitrospina sp.]MBT5763051.1 DUF2846 domain-containing protein [Nitrospina sp.]
MKKSIFVTLVVMIIAGCATVPTAPPGLDMEAKSFVANPDKATIYIYRDELFGAAIGMNIMLDGVYLGRTAAKTYFRVEVDAGNHTVQSFAENTVEVSLTVEIGKIYFVRQEVKMGFISARSDIYLVENVEGQEAVKECKLIATN